MSDRLDIEREATRFGGIRGGGPARLAALPALLFLLTALLSSCTGTSEVGPSTLLVLAAEDAGGPHLQLVEDTFGTETPVAERFRTIPNGRLALPAPAVAFDLGERLVARDELFVLSRTDTAPFRAYLSRIDVLDLDPTASDPFAGRALPPVDVTAVVSAYETFAGQAPCPVALQATRDGRHAALLSDSSACPDDVGIFQGTAVIVLDLEAAGGPEVVRALTTETFLGEGLYLAQAEVPGDAERLYYLQQGAGGAELQALQVPDGDPFTVAPLDDGAYRDLAPALGALVALQSSSFQAVDPLEGVAAEASVATETGATRVVPDGTGLTEAMVVLAGARAAVHASLEDAEPQILTVDATGAALVPRTRFAYLLTKTDLVVIDLLGYTDDDATWLPSDRYGRFPLRTLGLDTVTDTGPLGWVLAAFDETP